MGRSYLEALFSRAARQAWCAVISRTWPELAKKVVIAVFVIALLYVGIERVDPRDDAYDDQVVIAKAVMLATVIAAGGLFVINLLFVAPYQLWREERVRADAATPPANSAAERALLFHNSIDALRRIANDRELWFAAQRRKEGPSPLADRHLKAISRVREFFPPEAPGDFKEDQVSQLWAAAVSYGRELGYAHGETERLKKRKDAFEQEIEKTVQAFERLNGSPNTEYDRIYRDEVARLTAIKRAEATVRFGGVVGGMADAVIEFSKDEEARRVAERQKKFGPKYE